MLFDYDDTSVDSIYNYAKRLEGMTFNQIFDEYQNSVQKYYVNPNSTTYYVSEPSMVYGEKIPSANAKGQLGNFLERYYFGYNPNGIQEADFSKTGMELKQTCIDLKKDGTYSAGERLSITNISYNEPVEEDFYKSHVWDKIKLILLVHYLRDKSKERFDYEIKFVNLFKPPVDDLTIIIQDYLKIINKIKAGKANELSESDTLYLGACTKGATAEKSLAHQYYNDSVLAKKRNFCFKRQYMDYVLHEYVLKNKLSYESIIKVNNLNQSTTFEEQIISLINKHIGKTDEELCAEYNQEYDKKKSMWISLGYKMLGIKSNHASEFEKANIKVKSIRLEENGHMVESMSLPSINFKELAEEDYEGSSFCNYFEETKFLFIVYKSNGENYVLKGAQLWNMPALDLYGKAQEEWQTIHDKIVNGVTFTIKNNIVSNDLLNKKNSVVLHMRPHTSKSAYKLNNGYERGNIECDGDQLPNGEWMTKQSFWLNNSYILSQLDKHFFD